MLQGSRAKDGGTPRPSLIPALPGSGVHGGEPRERWHGGLMLGDPPASDGPHSMALHPIPKLPSSAASPPLGARAAPACAGLGTLSTVLPVPRAATDHLGLRQGMCPGPRSTWGCHGQNHP